MTTILSEIKVQELVRDRLTLRISLKGIKVWRVRLWFGMRILKLAAWVIGCGIKVED